MTFFAVFFDLLLLPCEAEAAGFGRLGDARDVDDDDDDEDEDELEEKEDCARSSSALLSPEELMDCALRLTAPRLTSDPLNKEKQHD